MFHVGSSLMSYISAMELFALPIGIELKMYSESLICRGSIQCAVNLWTYPPEFTLGDQHLPCASRQQAGKQRSHLAPYTDDCFRPCSPYAAHRSYFMIIGKGLLTNLLNMPCLSTPCLSTPWYCQSRSTEQPRILIHSCSI